jgi:hypothetical protein
MDVEDLRLLIYDSFRRTGRLERGYVRGEPSEAKEYFRGVGLNDPFWGT